MLPHDFFFRPRCYIAGGTYDVERFEAELKWLEQQKSPLPRIPVIPPRPTEVTADVLAGDMLVSFEADVARAYHPDPRTLHLNADRRERLSSGKVVCVPTTPPGDSYSYDLLDPKEREAYNVMLGGRQCGRSERLWRDTPAGRAALGGRPDPPLTDIRKAGKPGRFFAADPAGDDDGVMVECSWDEAGRTTVRRVHLPKRSGLRVKPFFRWYDLWIGAYIDTENKRVYICPFPMFGVCIEWGERS